MTARIVLAVGDAGTVAEKSRWARTPVRVLESGSPGWVWVLPDAPTAALDRAVEETSEHGAALLLTVGDWRSELQLWRSERPVLVLGWEPAGASGLEPSEAVSAARELTGLIPDVDERALAVLLAGPRPGAGAWIDVIEFLRLPLPAGFPRLAGQDILCGQGERVSTTGLLQALGLEDDVRWMAGYIRWVFWVVLAIAAVMNLGVAVARGSLVNLAVGLVALAALGWWVARYRIRRKASSA